MDAVHQLFDGPWTFSCVGSPCWQLGRATYCQPRRAELRPVPDCKAAASFLAFAYALNHGAHIRVSIVLNAVPRKVRRWLDVWCFAIGAAVMWYFVWYGWRFVYWSWKFGDVSQGQDATPLWIPQSAMLLGAVILAIALTDHLIHVIATGKHRIRQNLSDQSFGE